MFATVFFERGAGCFIGMAGVAFVLTRGIELWGVLRVFTQIRGFDVEPRGPSYLVLEFFTLFAVQAQFSLPADCDILVNFDRVTTT